MFYASSKRFANVKFAAIDLIKTIAKNDFTKYNFRVRIN